MEGVDDVDPGRETGAGGEGDNRRRRSGQQGKKPQAERLGRAGSAADGIGPASMIINPRRHALRIELCL